MWGQAFSLPPALSRRSSRLWRDAGQKPGGRLKAWPHRHAGGSTFMSCAPRMLCGIMALECQKDDLLDSGGCGQEVRPLRGPAV